MSRIKAVETRQDIKDFIAVPRLVQGSDPNFISRLDFEMAGHLGPKNPYFRHAKHCFFTAYNDNNSPCGRISAQIDKLAQKDGRPTLGHFGLIEADSAETMSQLLETARSWLEGAGAQRMAGPFSLSINDECGLLVEGVESAPFLMMNHAPRWYGETIESAGYSKAKDLIAYLVDVKEPLPPGAERMAEQALKAGNVSERGLDMKHFDADLNTVMEIFNDAWVDNWGFVPMTEDEIAYSAENMKLIIRPELARIAYVDNEPAAMIVALPDLNEAVRDLNGQIFPFGWAKLLWRLKAGGVRGARVLLMGVKKQYEGGMLSAALSALLVKRLRAAALKEGIRNIEMSWVLEDNKPTDRLIKMIGGKPYKRYRIYEKELG